MDSTGDTAGVSANTCLSSHQKTTLDFVSSMSEIESVCLSCRKNGVTKFLPTSIPYFRDIIIAAFECPHCGYRNSELFNTTPIAEFGSRFELNVSCLKDLSRQVVVSEYCRISLPVVDFHVEPPGRSSGYLTTVEGLLTKWIESIRMLISSEGEVPAVRMKLEDLASKFSSLLQLSSHFSLILDDPSGGSFLERFELQDLAVVETHYRRTPEQHAELGLAHPPESPQRDDLDPSLYTFSDSCPACGHCCDTRMHPIDIPHFREVIIMATVCDVCGYKSSEVKGGGAIQPKGRRITLKMQSLDDLSRDILKSTSCSVSIPEIALDLGTGTLGGRFTTVEGLLDQIREELVSKIPFAIGDSADINRKQHLDKVVSSLNDITEGTLKCTLIVDDPLGNSYIQSLYAPDPDPQITEEEYERSFEQNEEFGLNDIRVDVFCPGEDPKDQ